ncbi:hypothetical protein P152DRAFT_19328 [Eremomyces bilateralis CBS 781.70]|uniref:Uncharacterized protein n=1 Tax=Eremomyces bilateralis CBS 781.70 TaxID=1392243 RepID=A0A6G1GH69_9PEZI|nr:uncharacterized protein P152DRAFT_19328 [Eremomyces bilateralis CBS 781.70]KAF1817447.1 hypothetical protein P152DRAFT_19328 [Eremomyces bilateralis CBS 781.70]
MASSSKPPTTASNPFEDVTAILGDDVQEHMNPLAGLVRLQDKIIVRTPFSSFEEKAGRLSPKVFQWALNILEKNSDRILSVGTDQGGRARKCTGISIREIPFASVNFAAALPYIVGVANFEGGFPSVFRLRVDAHDYTLEGSPLYLNLGPLPKWKSSALWLQAKEKQRPEPKLDYHEWHLVNRKDWAKDDGPDYDLSDFEVD